MNDVPVDCPFCLGNNLLKSAIIAQCSEAYLTENIAFAGNFLIIPTYHAETLMDLHDDWWRNVKELLVQVPKVLESYNVSFNIGPSAGQTGKHIHLWVVPRQLGEPASGMGLSTLIKFRNEHE